MLFSGGLDCICLAALADQHLPLTESIDLLNVAFENPRIEKAKTQKVKTKKNKKNKNVDEEVEKPLVVEPVRSIYDTPDRLTGRAGVEELRYVSRYLRNGMI